MIPPEPAGAGSLLYYARNPKVDMHVCNVDKGLDMHVCNVDKGSIPLPSFGIEPKTPPHQKISKNIASRTIFWAIFLGKPTDLPLILITKEENAPN